MINKHFERCDRFESKFGEGAVLFVITLLQKHKTYEEIIQDLFDKYGKRISLSQLYKYTTSFILTEVRASEHVEKYYHRKQFEDHYIQLVEQDRRFTEIARQDNIIFANFLPEGKKDAGKI